MYSQLIVYCSTGDTSVVLYNDFDFNPLITYHLGSTVVDLSLKSQAAGHQEIKKEDLENQEDFTDDDIDDDLDEEDCDNDSIGTSTARPGATTVLSNNFQVLNFRFHIQTYVQLLG